MRSLMAIAVALSFALPLVLPAEAQTRLPRKSAAERRTDQINRSLERQQDVRSIQQQYQFENNQIRQSISREKVFSSPTPPTIGLGNCPPSSVGCR